MGTRIPKSIGAASLLLLAIAAGPTHAQPAPAFEVASVKASPARSGSAAYTSLNADPALVRYSNITLANLIALAYHFDSRLISGGPGWLDSDPYDVVAKLPAGASKDRVPEMLQRLLAERFHLAVHRETREQRVYFLVAARNGPKLKPGREGGGQNQMLPGRIMGGSMPTGLLASLLARFVGSQVVDKTGLAGLFDIDLKWKSEPGQGNDPELFAALQEQLGLKLEPGKGPVETLVVDGADRIPVEN